MALGFPAYHEEDQQFEHSAEELLDAVEEALDALGWSFSYKGRGLFGTTTPISFWSWGERIQIEVGRQGDVWVRSECALPTQCFDWGKNRRNVNKFLDQLETVLSFNRARARRGSSPRVADEYREPSSDPSRIRRAPPHGASPPAPPSSDRPRPRPGDDAIQR
jgi:hypothetical protein